MAALLNCETPLKDYKRLTTSSEIGLFTLLYLMDSNHGCLIASRPVKRFWVLITNNFLIKSLHCSETDLNSS
jgi:hypothetical protein